jgi:hypothetical protein
MSVTMSSVIVGAQSSAWITRATYTTPTICRMRARSPVRVGYIKKQRPFSSDGRSPITYNASSSQPVGRAHSEHAPTTSSRARPRLNGS